MPKPIRLSLFAAFAAFGAGCAALPVSSDYTGGSGNGSTANEVAAVSGSTVRECRWAKATGTKMRSRICHSQAVWAQIDAATAQAEDTDTFFRRQREGATAAGNVAVPDIRGGGIGL